VRSNGAAITASGQVGYSRACDNTLFSYVGVRGGAVRRHRGNELVHGVAARGFGGPARRKTRLVFRGLPGFF